ncbi:MAG TPA: lactate utilization protein C [Steroidobacteraceae bacterium]|nr:lactate utilization protein C [Steroidobacteraceae bacterium]
MTNGREQILGSIRKSLKRGAVTDARAKELKARLDAHTRNLIPARAAGLTPDQQVELFIRMAEGVQASVVRVTSAAEVPGAVADYLADKNLPAKLVMTPDPQLDGIPWTDRPLLEIRRGRAEDGDLTGVTACVAGVAETGTLMLASGPESPTRNNFLPDHHLVVMRRNQVVATYEDGFDRLRAGAAGAGEWVPPRTVNFITGPSRTGDIEQKIELGAHGPRRLHIILIDEG